MSPLERNPLICDKGPEDIVSRCAEVLQIVGLATGTDEDGFDRDNAGYHLILTAVRNALKYEVEQGLRRTEVNVSQLAPGD